MSKGSHSYPNSYQFYLGSTSLPTAPTLASGEIIATTSPGISQWVPASSALSLAIPDNVTYYVASTGDDTTGTGTSGNPFLTITKAVSYIGLTGYNISATIRLLDNVDFDLTPSTDLRPHGSGEQLYPIVITNSADTVVETGEVQSCTSDPVTGLWTLTATTNAFDTATVGQRLVFTSGVFSNYTPISTAQPVDLITYITSIISPDTVTLSFSDNTTPSPGDIFELVTEQGGLITNIAGVETDVVIQIDELRFDNISWSITNTTESTTIRFLGEQLITTGFTINTSCNNADINIFCSCLLSTTFGAVNVGDLTPSNNFCGLSIFANALTTTTFGSLVSGSITLENSFFNAVDTINLAGTITMRACKLVGDCSILGTRGGCIVSNSDLDASSTSGSILLNNSPSIISSTRISNGTVSAITANESTLSLLEVSVTNCASGFILQRSQLSIDSLTTFTSCGPNLLTLSEGSNCFATGNLNWTTTGTTPSTQDAAIVIVGASSFTSNNDVTLQTQARCLTVLGNSSFTSTTLDYTVTGGPAAFLDNSSVRLTTLTGINTDGAGFVAQYNSTIAVSGVTTLTTVASGQALIIQEASRFTATGVATINGPNRAITINRDSTFSSSDNIVVAVSINTGEAIRLGNISTLTTPGTLTLSTSDPGGTGISATYGASCNLGDVDISGFNLGIDINLGSTFQCNNGTLSSIGNTFNCSNATIITSGTINVSSSSGQAIGLFSSSFRGNNVTLGQCNIGMRLERSSMACNNISMASGTPAADYALWLIQSNLVCGDVTLYADTTPIELTTTSSLSSTGTIMASGGSPGGNAVRCSRNSAIAATSCNFTISDGAALRLFSGSRLKCQSSITLTATAGQALTQEGSDIQAGNQVILRGDTTPTVTNSSLACDTLLLQGTAGDAISVSTSAILVATNISTGGGGGIGTGNIILSDSSLRTPIVGATAGSFRFVAERTAVTITTSIITSAASSTPLSLTDCTGYIEGMNVSGLSGPNVIIAGGEIRIFSISSSTGVGGEPRVSLSSLARVKIDGVNFSGALGTNAFEAVEGCSLSIFGGGIVGCGTANGISMVSGYLFCNFLTISDQPSNGMRLTGVTGRLVTVGGVGNTVYGVNLVGACWLTTNTCSIEGGTGDVFVGGQGGKTWAQVSGGVSTNICDLEESMVASTLRGTLIYPT